MRVSKDTRERLNRLAAKMNVSAPAAIARLVQDWEDAEILRAASTLGPETAAEVAEWDGAVADGLAAEDFGTWH